MALLLDEDLSPAVRRRKLKRLLDRFASEHLQRQRAKKSHRKSRWRKLHQRGIRLSRLRKCYNVF